jgi:hypothetical protein
MARQPKDLEYRAEYEPDMARMVKALRVLLEYDLRKGERHDNPDIPNTRRAHLQMRYPVL